MSDILNFRGPETTRTGAITVAADQHYGARNGKTNGHGKAMISMLKGWAAYADAHRERFEDGIGQDGVLGQEWEAIGRALLGLLNGETGGLDCGSIDGNIRDALAAEGFDRG